MLTVNIAEMKRLTEEHIAADAVVQDQYWKMERGVS